MLTQRSVATVLFLILTICIVTKTAFCSESDGWIKSDTCWVVKTPSTKAKIVGIILKKAAVTVEDAGGGWLKIVFAPVRDPKTGNWIECTGCYIQKSNFTTTFPR